MCLGQSLRSPLTQEPPRNSRLRHLLINPPHIHNRRIRDALGPLVESNLHNRRSCISLAMGPIRLRRGKGITNELSGFLVLDRFVRCCGAGLGHCVEEFALGLPAVGEGHEGHTEATTDELRGGEWISLAVFEYAL